MLASPYVYSCLFAWIGLCVAWKVSSWYIFETEAWHSCWYCCSSMCSNGLSCVVVALSLFRAYFLLTKSSDIRLSASNGDCTLKQKEVNSSLVFFSPHFLSPSLSCLSPFIQLGSRESFVRSCVSLAEHECLRTHWVDFEVVKRRCDVICNYLKTKRVTDRLTVTVCHRSSSVRCLSVCLTCLALPTSHLIRCHFP